MHETATRFEELFQAVYLTFHRRDEKRSELSGASRAVLNHLARTGPLTVGEAALHLDRAQSVVSEIVSQLERNGLLERERDPADRRRTLVWLTSEGQERLARDRAVLDTTRLAEALDAVPADTREALLAGMRALLTTKEKS
ncbi:MarR family winged helix-turn-helix transcriptional regulator [Cryptosporangium arvum]|uniref:MarR family winged helix-turn-helix transcriptional regulator n=1 Tax=Cryptosporangium arvum TaxID=80871 RepID=UPI0004B3D003|nr:MarR family winged helix-turn-helix transcriptional regulator [Cryptosporangium arvum]